MPALAGAGYDLLNVAGAFAHGGSVAIDVSAFAPGSGFVKDVKLIGWTSEMGARPLPASHYQLRCPALPYEFRSDGLYLTDVSYSFIPEPSTIANLLIGLVPYVVGNRRRGTRRFFFESP